MSTVLIVDDEPGIVELARLYLEQDGFRVETAATGPEGLKQVQAQSPDLVILDVMLPGLDGFGVCREIRRQGDIGTLVHQGSQVERLTPHRDLPCPGEAGRA